MSKTKTSKHKSTHRVPIYQRPWVVVIFFLAMAVAVVLALLFIKPNTTTVDVPIDENPSSDTETTPSQINQTNPPKKSLTKPRNTRVKTLTPWSVLPVRLHVRVLMPVF